MGSEARYPHLFSPLKIGPVEVRNRIMQSAHGKSFAVNGVKSRRVLDYHTERARHGIGLIVTGIHHIHPSSPRRRNSVGYLEEAIPVDRLITDAVHSHGARIFAQLGHYGAMGPSDALDDYRVLWSPSGVRLPIGETPKRMEVSEIDELVAAWSRSARLAKAGGYDGVELHFAHNYLMHTFLSATTNLRDDAYGGSSENRMRFAREVIDAVRTEVGQGFVVGVRLAMSEFSSAARYGIEDCIKIAKAFEQDDEIDYLSLSIAGFSAESPMISPSDVSEGYLIELAGRVKSHLSSTAVFVVGGINDAAHAEAILAAGQGDMVAMTRAQIADPELVEKIRTGREDEIYRCIRGNQGCAERGVKNLPISCTVNPRTGREGRFPILEPVAEPGRWLVVGGGPAGMKAAETLAKRGHRVWLAEREDDLGGQVQLILRTPKRESFGWLVKNLTTQLRKAKVEILTGQAVDSGMVRSLAPDAVIVATGAVSSRAPLGIAPLVQPAAGCDLSNVWSAWDVIRGSAEIGDRVVVLDDEGGRCAAGTVELLLDRGKEVEVISRFASLFPQIPAGWDSTVVLKRLFHKGFRYRLHSWVNEISTTGVTVHNLFLEDRHETLAAESVVFTSPPVADDALYFELLDEVEHVHRVGDCVAPRRLDHAIYEGYIAGLELLGADERYLPEGLLERWPETVSSLGGSAG